MNNERLMVMRNKIENVGLEDCGVDGGLVAEIIDELIDSRYKIDELTAERDEARKELADLLKVAPGVEEIDALENEYLFTLKTLGHLGSLADRYSLRDLAVKLASLARRAIASRDEEKERADECRTNMFQAEQERDEVVGLLSEAKKYNLLGEMEHMALFRGSEPSVVVRVSKKILEIVEGK